MTSATFVDTSRGLDNVQRQGAIPKGKRSDVARFCSNVYEENEGGAAD